MQNFITNMLYVLFPILIYFVFEAYYKIFSKNNSKLFEIFILMSIYMIIILGLPIYEYDYFYLFNIPLFLSYLKKKNSLAILISFIIIFYSFYCTDYNVMIIILNYILCFLLYKIDKKYFIYTYLILNIIFLLILNKFDIDYIIVIIFYILTFYTVLFLFNQTQKIINFYVTLKGIENNKQLQDSLFKISHEIKNPIAVCKGYLELMDGSISTYKKYVPIIEKEIDHSLLILKDFSSLGKLKIEKDIMDINMLLEEVVEEFKLIFLKNNIKISLEFDSEELYIMGDYIRLKEVFINLIKNSIDALENSSEPMIRIITEQIKNKIYIKVVDNGCGMDNDNLAKIEEPFFTTKKDGTGLGTYLSKEIIEGHNGIITFFAKKNKGMQVSIKMDAL